jgi:hypothetical protein
MTPGPPGSWRNPGSLSDVDARLPPPAAALVKALLVRASFGGMECDRELLTGYAGLWAARFLGLAAAPPALDGGEDAASAAAAAVAAGQQEQDEQQQQQQQAKGLEQEPGGVQEQAPASSAALSWLAFLSGSFGPSRLPLGIRAPRVTLVGPLQR